MSKKKYPYSKNKSDINKIDECNDNEKNNDVERIDCIIQENNKINNMDSNMDNKQIDEDLDLSNVEQFVDSNLKDVSSGKIRKFLILVNYISNKINSTDISNNELPKSIIEELKYMKIQLVYLVGREKQEDIEDKSEQADKNSAEKNKKEDKKTVKKPKPIEILFNRIEPYLETIRTVDDFNKLHRYIEAIVAYHKYLGGK